MPILPGDSYTGVFTTQRIDSGQSTDADSLPTATAMHNGVDDPGNMALTVTRIDTGRYKVTGTVSGTYVAGDTIHIVVNASVNLIQGKQVIDSFTLDKKRNADLDVVLERVLGLSQDNWVMKNIVLDGSGNMTSADILVYDTAAHATTDDGSTGLLYQWSLVGTITSGLLTKAVQTRVL